MRLAVAGLGFMGSTHLKALRNVPGVELVAVLSRDEKKLAGDLTGTAGNLGGPGERFDFSQVRKYRDLASALADPGIEALDICLPSDLHENWALEALRHGKHVLVEKPMALDGTACDRMIHEARQQRRVLMVAQVLRFFPAYRALVSALKTGELGAVRGGIFRRRCARPFWSDWLPDRARSGGGVFDLLIHDVDMALHLFGAPEAIAATGHENIEIGVDLISARLFYGSGLVVEIEGGWYHAGFPFSMEYTVVADGGTLDYNSALGSPRRYGADGPGEDLPLKGDDGYAAEIAYFAQCCQSGEEPVLCRPEESAAAVRLTRAIEQARRRNGEKIPCQS
jgi:predicted dehydrogenase